MFESAIFVVVEFHHTQIFFPSKKEGFFFLCVVFFSPGYCTQIRVVLYIQLYNFNGGSVGVECMDPLQIHHP